MGAGQCLEIRNLGNTYPLRFVDFHPNLKYRLRQPYFRHFSLYATIEPPDKTLIRRHSSEKSTSRKGAELAKDPP